MPTDAPIRRSRGSAVRCMFSSDGGRNTSRCRVEGITSPETQESWLTNLGTVPRAGRRGQACCMYVHTYQSSSQPLSATEASRHRDCPSQSDCFDKEPALYAAINCRATFDSILWLHDLTQHRNVPSLLARFLIVGLRPGTSNLIDDHSPFWGKGAR